MPDLPKVSHYGTIHIGDLTFDGIVLEGHCVSFNNADLSDGFGFVFQNFNKIHESFRVDRDRFFNLFGAARDLCESDKHEVEGLCYVPFCTLTHLFDFIVFPQHGDCTDVSIAIARSAKAFMLRQFAALKKVEADDIKTDQLRLFCSVEGNISKTKKTTQQRPSCVYFAEAGGLIKIGVTENVKARLSSLQTGCPSPITLIKVIRGGRKTEERIHKRFSHLRTKGEWFQITDDLNSYIAGLKDKEVSS